MLGRVITAALLIGVFAGLMLGVVQQLNLTPLIIAAEQFEVESGGQTGHGHAHSHGSVAGAETTPNAVEPASEAEEWAPAPGFERSLYTFLATMLTGAGFAAILTGVSFLSGIPITTANGILWGLAGFVTFALAPAAGLPPHLPGMPEADLNARMVWWLGTVLFTAAGIYALTRSNFQWRLVLAAVLILAPHIWGAPKTTELDSAVPTELVAQFVGSSLAANAAFWIVLGMLLGTYLPKFEFTEPK